MKNLKIYIVLSIFVLYCKYAYTQSSDHQSTQLVSKVESIGKINLNYLINNRQQLLQTIEHRRDSTLLLLSDTQTLIKQCVYPLGSNERKIIFYYNHDNIIAIVNRIFDSKSELKSYKVFYFTENNICDWYTVKDNKDNYSLTYTLIDSTIIESDYKDTPTILNGTKKNQVINSAKTSLDSIMLFFPEFKYSFKWR